MDLPAGRQVDVQALVDDSFDADSAKRYIDERSREKLGEIAGEKDAALAGAEQQRQSMRQRAREDHQRDLSAIVDADQAALRSIRQESDQAQADTAARLRQAKADLDAALADARRKRQAKETGDAGPGKLDDPREIIHRAKAALDGMGDQLAGQAAKIGSQGTFLAGNVLGLQAGDGTDRMADGIEKIERNTRTLRDAQGVTFQ